MRRASGRRSRSLSALALGVAALAAGSSAQAQFFGPWFVFDARAWLQGEREALARERDADVQARRLETEREMRAIEEEQVAQLDELIAAFRASGDGSGGSGTPAMIDALEDGPVSASSLYGAEDTTPAAARLFGDANLTIEELIIQVAKDTHHYPGVGAAGLSVVQWRCLLQALIWQESRFQIGARSPVAAFGLTQIMPDTARYLGIYPEFYTDPYVQVEGGARYLAEQLQRFDGNIVYALAAYNAGPGRVQQYNGVPPFDETQTYVRVIPAKYNSYLAQVGGIDALGTIDPALLAGATLSLTADAASIYAGHTNAMLAGSAARLRAIVERIRLTADPEEAMALNTYARAEVARLTVMAVRLRAAATKRPGAEEIALAAARADERAFTDFTLEDLR